MTKAKVALPTTLRSGVQYSPRELMVGSGLFSHKSGLNTDVYNQWLYRGIFSATWESKGSGTSSKYSKMDIMAVAIIRDLQAFGMSLKKCSEIAKLAVSKLNDWENKCIYQQDDYDGYWPDLYITDHMEVLFDPEFPASALIRLGIGNIYQNIIMRYRGYNAFCLNKENK
jgi:hypothetical protein